MLVTTGDPFRCIVTSFTVNRHPQERGRFNFQSLDLTYNRAVAYDREQRGHSHENQHVIE
jgi:hypothetical protein